MNIVINDLQAHGLWATRRTGRTEPDIILTDISDTPNAAMIIKTYKIHDKSGQKNRYISRKQCLSAIKFAEKFNTVVVLHVTNILNGRRWMCKILPEDLKEWDGTATPDILAKNDEMSNKTLDEDYSEKIIELGGIA